MFKIKRKFNKETGYTKGYQAIYEHYTQKFGEEYANLNSQELRKLSEVERANNERVCKTSEKYYRTLDKAKVFSAGLGYGAVLGLVTSYKVFNCATYDDLLSAFAVICFATACSTAFYGVQKAMVFDERVRDIKATVFEKMADEKQTEEVMPARTIPVSLFTDQARKEMNK